MFVLHLQHAPSCAIGPCVVVVLGSKPQTWAAASSSEVPHSNVQQSQIIVNSVHSPPVSEEL